MRFLIGLVVLLCSHVASAQFPSIASLVETKDSGSTKTIELPATIEAGDTLMLFVCSESGAHSFPGSWAEIADLGGGAAGGQLAVAWLEAVGDEDGTTVDVTGGSNNTVALAVAITGAIDPSTQAPEITTSSGDSGSANPPSLSPTGGSKSYLWIATACSDSCPSESATPASYTKRNVTNCTSGARYWVWDRALAAASENPGPFQWDDGNEGWGVATVAIHPGAGSVVPLFEHHYRGMRGTTK